MHPISITVYLQPMSKMRPGFSMTLLPQGVSRQAPVSLFESGKALRWTRSKTRTGNTEPSLAIPNRNAEGLSDHQPGTTPSIEPFEGENGGAMAPIALQIDTMKMLGLPSLCPRQSKRYRQGPAARETVCQVQRIRCQKQQFKLHGAMR